MSFFCRLSRKHYWCTPHRSAAHGRLVQVCYECGSERPAREFHDDFATERLNHSLASAKTESAKFSSRHLMEERPTASARLESVAVGQHGARRFLLVK
jgi:hypothetical protein